MERRFVTQSESPDSWWAPPRVRKDVSLFAREAIQMFAKKEKIARTGCDHPITVTVRNSGIERTVCETCGHVSFRALESLSGTADRRMFERAAERPTGSTR